MTSPYSFILVLVAAYSFVSLKIIFDRLMLQKNRLDLFLVFQVVGCKHVFMIQTANALRKKSVSDVVPESNVFEGNFLICCCDGIMYNLVDRGFVPINTFF